MSNKCPQLKSSCLMLKLDKQQITRQKYKMNSNLTLKNNISNLLLINNTISKSRIKNNSKFPKTNKLSVKQLFKNKSCKAK